MSHLAEDNWAAGFVAKAVTQNYYNLPKGFRKAMLLKLVEKNKARKIIEEFLKKNPNELEQSDDMKNELFTKLPKKKKRLRTIPIRKRG